MLNLVIVLIMFLLLVLSTFFVVDLPFITFIFAKIPDSVNVTYQNSILAMGTFSSSLQIPVIILSSLLLNPRLNFVFLITYYGIGFYGIPIFYSGGGYEYLSQPTVGYLLSFLPASIFLSKFAWKDNNFDRYLLNTRYIFFLSFLTLLFIHLVGLLTALFFTNSSSKFLNMFQSYFYIPFLSQLMLIAVICIISKIINKSKFAMVNSYRSFTDNALKKSTKRRRLAKKPTISESL